MSDAPQIIYLQWHGDGDPEDQSPVNDLEVTWCADAIYDGDVPYIRADVAYLWLSDGTTGWASWEPAVGDGWRYHNKVVHIAKRPE